MNFGANDLKDDISISIVLLKKTNGVYLSVKRAFIFLLLFAFWIYLGSEKNSSQFGKRK